MAVVLWRERRERCTMFSAMLILEIFELIFRTWFYQIAGTQV